ncbi:MAG: LPS assembly lipoprotein LptE [Rhodobacteraceae bacterium]|nr:LPS assembly lipoprotein LptE [Paracoccaceae bacterium]
MLLCRLVAATVLLVAFSVAACGFKPAAIDRSGDATVFGNTKVEVAGDQAGYHFERVLQRKFGFASRTAPYHLKASIGITGAEAAIQGSGGHYRFELVGTVGFTLVDAAGETVLESSATEIVYWGSKREVIANLAARRDAEQRLYNELADRVFTSVIAAQATHADSTMERAANLGG